MYELPDAAVYHSMLRHFRPRRVLEVGSGYSTAVALDTLERYEINCKITCIEPNPERLQSLVLPRDQLDLHRSLVQDAPLELFTSLQSGDFLFIDSTHVVKAGSDVVYTTLRVLPRLAAGVLVHVHDVFWPLEYQEKWLRGRRDWNEIYLLHAFLSGNRDWKVELFTDYIWQTQDALVREHLPAAVGRRPGGMWLRKLV